jgi:asparaginyl-tRNA synthetase
MSDIPTIRIADAGKHVGGEVRLAGWLYNLRKSGKIVFPQIRDGSGIMQCVGVKSELPEDVFETLKHRPRKVR